MCAIGAQGCEVTRPILSGARSGEAVDSVAAAAASAPSLQPQLPRAPTGPAGNLSRPSGVRDSWSEVTVLEGGMPALCHNNIEIRIRENNTQPFLFKGE